MNTNRLIEKYWTTLTKTKPPREAYLNLTTLSKNHQQIMQQFIELITLKQKVAPFKFYFQKNFDPDFETKNLLSYQTYLKAFKAFIALIKKYEKQNYGFYINQATKLLAKVWYENHH